MALSNFDIKHVLDELGIKTIIIRYEELFNTKPADLLRRDHIIFFGYPDNIGHWTALFNKGNKIEFFDPYGFYPDEQWKYIENKQHQKPPEKILSKLLEKLIQMGYQVTYNPYNVQGYLVQHSFGPIEKELSRNECGELIILRLLLKQLSNREFYEYIKKLGPIQVYCILFCS